MTFQKNPWSTSYSDFCYQAIPMTCIAKLNIKFISTSHQQQSGVLEQFFWNRFVFDRYFYHKLQKKKKNPSILYVSPYSALKLWQHYFFEGKDTFRNVDCTIPHNISNHFHYASVWICLKLQQHCLLSHYWKNNNNNKKPH